MNVCIIGTGYVGLVTGACFAERGHQVVCVDRDPAKVHSIASGVAPIHEHGLGELLGRNVGTRLTASTNLEASVAAAEVILVCVGTPPRGDQIDLSQVIATAEQIGKVLASSAAYKVVVVKSTVIPGTTDGVFRSTLEAASGKKAGTDFGLAMNPEFLTEGTAVEDFMHPDRIVIGGIDERSRDRVRSLYLPWPKTPIVMTNTTTAEMIKYASNAVLATLISFSNEIGRLCSALGNVDVVDVMNGVHEAAYFTSRLEDGRKVLAPITRFLGAGCGFGGSCLPKDVNALIAQGAGLDLGMPMLRSVLETNRSQPQEMLALIHRHRMDLNGCRIAVLGLAFKPDTDDTRESPAFPIVAMLKRAGATLKAYDPVARLVAHSDLEGVEQVDTLRSAVADAEIIVLITRWQEFAELPALLREMSARPLVVDGRRMLQPSDFERYEGIGR